MGKNRKKDAKLRDIFSDPEFVSTTSYLSEAPNDLTRILLISSSLEVALEQLLLRVLIKGCKQTLFDHNGPLGTFSSRTEMAYALGLISESEYKSLTYIRKIRNRFAHSGGNHKLDFEDDQIKNWTQEIEKLFGLFAFFQKYSEDYKPVPSDILTTAYKLHLLSLHFEMTRSKTRHPMPAEDSLLRKGGIVMLEAFSGEIAKEIFTWLQSKG